MNELQKSFIENSPSFLMHYNHNHDPKTGRFTNSLFVSGSSKTQDKNSGYYRKKLPKEVRRKLKESMRAGDRIIVGDAPGIDRQVQDYLKKKRYKNVEVYGPGKEVRYAASDKWKTNPVDAPEFKEGSKEWLAKKDVAMTDAATKGLAIVLDEGSTATKNNVVRLKNQGKDVEVFELSKKGNLFDDWDTYSDAKKIFDSLSSKDKKNLTSNDEYSKSPMLVSRKVLKDNAFAEIEHDPDDENIGYISVATSPNARGKGYAKQIASEVISDAERKGLREIYWETTKDNPDSGALARSLGFEKTKSFSDEDDNYVYRIYNQYEHNRYIGQFAPPKRKKK